jgi:myo-inositol 2-dehydrogenase / D-chiro-inositol 1-dehydrogenase
VGAGAVARCVHLPILARRSDRFAIAAICDPFVDAAKLAADRFGIAEVFANSDEMFASDRLDAVLVLHSGTHAPTVLAALGAGLGVFSEKPLAYTRAEVAAIAAAANGRPVMVGYMKAYDPAVVRAREYVDVAAVRSVEVLVRHPPPPAQLAHSELEPPGLLTGTPPPPPSDADLLIAALGPAAGPLGRTYADIVLGSLSHDLAVMRAVGLSIDRVEWARRWGGPTVDGHFSLAVAGWTAGGASVSLRWHYLPQYPAYREEVRFHHDGGSVELVFPTPYLLRAPTELRVNRATETGEAITVERSPVEAFEEELVAFHDLVLNGRAPHDGIDSGLADVVTAQKVVAAIAAAEGVELGGEAAQRS